MTTILEELRAKRSCPFDENVNRKASPWGKAAEELGEAEISLIDVFRGRRKTSKTPFLASQINLRLRSGRSSDIGEFDRASALDENAGRQPPRWWR
jgi:hypothetical protein